VQAHQRFSGHAAVDEYVAAAIRAEPMLQIDPAAHGVHGFVLADLLILFEKRLHANAQRSLKNNNQRQPRKEKLFPLRCFAPNDKTMSSAVQINRRNGKTFD